MESLLDILATIPLKWELRNGQIRTSNGKCPVIVLNEAGVKYCPDERWHNLMNAADNPDNPDNPFRPQLLKACCLEA